MILILSQRGEFIELCIERALRKGAMARRVS